MRSLKARVRAFLRHHLGVAFGSRRYFRYYELAQDLGHLVDRYQIDAILDVGANRGQFRHTLRRIVGYRGLIFSFEPVQACIEALRPQVARDARWFLFEYALGRQEETRTLHVSEDSRCSSFLDAAADVHGVPLKHDHDESVPVRRLEPVFAELKEAHGFRRAFLKLDTQGCDLEVLRGAGSALRECVALLTELSFLPIYDGMPDYATAFAELRGLGFDVAGFYPAVRDEDLRAIELDCLMVRRVARRAQP